MRLFLNSSGVGFEEFLKAHHITPICEYVAEDCYFNGSLMTGKHLPHNTAIGVLVEFPEEELGALAKCATYRSGVLLSDKVTAYWNDKLYSDVVALQALITYDGKVPSKQSISYKEIVSILRRAGQLPRDVIIGGKVVHVNKVSDLPNPLLISAVLDDSYDLQYAVDAVLNHFEGCAEDIPDSVIEELEEGMRSGGVRCYGDILTRCKDGCIRKIYNPCTIQTGCICPNAAKYLPRGGIKTGSTDLREVLAHKPYAIEGHRAVPQELIPFILKLAHVDVRRYETNLYVKAFDDIDVQFSCPSYLSKKAIAVYAKEYRKALWEYTLLQLENHQSWKKFHIPTSYIAPTRLVVDNTKTLHVYVELKKGLENIDGGLC